MQTVITGCGRSGTKYMAELLKLLGVNASHEKEDCGADVLVGWVFLTESNLHFTEAAEHVFVQYRDPYYCIPSLTTHCDGVFNNRAELGTAPTDKWERAAWFWARLNEYALQFADESYDISRVVDCGVWDTLGISRTDVVEAMWKLPQNVNTRPHVQPAPEFLEALGHWPAVKRTYTLLKGAVK